MELAEKQGRARMFRIALLGVIVVGLALVLLLVRNGPERPTPAPPFSPPLVDTPEMRAQINQYAAGLQFADSDNVDASDTRPLVRSPTAPGATASVGPLATIQPEIGAGSLKKKDLATGRIIAQITTHDTVTYAELGLVEQGTYYLWADSADNASRWTAWMIPRNVNRPMTPLSFNVLSHKRHEAVKKYPKAKWLYYANASEQTWGDCGGECCVGCSAARTCVHR